MTSDDQFRKNDRIRDQLEIEIVNKIAEGGMGEVYEAVLRGAFGFEKKLALKVVRPKLISESASDTGTEAKSKAREAFLLRLVEEAKLVSNLINTHIVQIYFFGVMNADDRAKGYIAMEFVNGVNLRSFIDKHIAEGRYVNADIAVYIASRLARALEYAHTRRDENGELLGIVHRDVSPANVLVSTEGVVKLSDFGIAKAAHTNRSYEGVVVGKKKYMSPEQMDGRTVDFRTDIFSLGLLFYELLTNQLPARSESTPQPPSQMRPELSPKIDEVIGRMCAHNAGDRYSSTRELALSLERIIYDQGLGPTFVTLSEYLLQLFPALARSRAVPAAADDRTVGATL